MPRIKARAAARPVEWTVLNAELVREEVDALCKRMAARPPDEYRTALLEAFEATPDRRERFGQLKRFFLALRIVEEQAATESFPKARVANLLELAEGILLTNGVKRGVSKLSLLWAEVARARSRTAFATGDLWNGLSHQFLAYHDMRRERPEDEARVDRESARAALRVGEARLALTLAPDQAALKGECLAYLGAVDDARKSLSSEASVEVGCAWELGWLACREMRSAAPILDLSAKGKPHHASPFLLEAHLAAYAGSSTALLKDLPAVKALARRKDAVISLGDPLSRLVAALDEAYDFEIPLETRLAQVMGEVGRVGKLPTWRTEALAWCAVARFLARSHSVQLAGLAWSEYRARSWRVSEGRTSDVLGLCSDLVEKDWFARGDVRS